MELKIVDLIKMNTALSPEVGGVVYSSIKNEIKNKNVTVLDFAGIDIMTTAFLNAAVGRLYSDFDSDTLNTYLKAKNLSTSDRSLLRLVVERAKDYFSNKEVFNKKIEDRYPNG